MNTTYEDEGSNWCSEPTLPYNSFTSSCMKGLFNHCRCNQSNLHKVTYTKFWWKTALGLRSLSRWRTAPLQLTNFPLRGSQPALQGPHLVKCLLPLFLESSHLLVLLIKNGENSVELLLKGTQGLIVRSSMVASRGWSSVEVNGWIKGHFPWQLPVDIVWLSILFKKHALACACDCTWLACPV